MYNVTTVEHFPLNVGAMDYRNVSLSHVKKNGGGGVRNTETDIFFISLCVFLILVAFIYMYASYKFPRMVALDS